MIEPSYVRDKRMASDGLFSSTKLMLYLYLFPLNLLNLVTQNNIFKYFLR